jgi:uncharacterized RDD family membrane protein YckC
MAQSGPPGAPGQQQPPAPPPPASWQQAPQQPAPPPARPPQSQMPSWTANLTSTAPVAGPAGFYYADVPNRIIAYIIDFIVLFIGLVIVALIVNAVIPSTTDFGTVANPAFGVVYGILAALATGAYFIYTWVAMRGTIGMKVLGMQIGDEKDGKSLLYNAAILRYVVLYGPFLLSDIVGRFALGLAVVLQLLGLIWFIALLITTAQSPTKQGLHDRQAHSVVVKSARSVA